MTKTILLSSSGLKNITLNKYKEEEDFIIAFGSQKFRMKSIFVFLYDLLKQSKVDPKSEKSI